MPRAKTWLEVSLNGPWTRQLQPNIPIAIGDIVAEGIACVRAGAAIVHVHAYDEASGRQKDDADLYAAIIEGIRAAVDAVVYPTIPLAGSADAPMGMAPQARFAAVEELARRDLLEWAVVDPGTVNIARYDAIAEDRQGFVYLNSEADIRAGLELAHRYQFHPGYACYEPGFVRLGAALHHRYPGSPTPIYRLMFSKAFAFGFPPERFALDAYRELLAREATGAPWMVAGLGVDILPLVPAAIEAGGHVRVGLEDAPFGSPLDNVSLVRRAAAMIDAAGGTLATAPEVRVALARPR